MSDPVGYSRWRRVWHEPLFKSSVGIVALLAVVGLLLTALNNIGEISFDFMASHWSFLLRYATTSLEATVISFAIGFGLAIPMGLVRAFGPGMIRRGGLRGGLASALYAIVTGYAEVIRGTPVLGDQHVPRGCGNQSVGGSRRPFGQHNGLPDGGFPGRLSIRRPRPD